MIYILVIALLIALLIFIGFTYKEHFNQETIQFLETNQICRVLKDVDFTFNKLDITIFDNNAPAYGNKKGYISLGNQIVTFRDLPTRPLENVKLIAQPHQFKKYGKEVESFSWLNKYMQPKTITQGLSEYIKENNSLMIEEQNYGRIFEYEIDSKKMLWEYINKESKESNPLYVGWSRRMLDLPGNLNEKSFNSCYGL